MGKTSEMHLQMQDQYMNAVNDAEIGNVGHLDTFIFLEEERKLLEQSLAIIKSYKDENLDLIEKEANEYGKEGYKGYKVEVRNGGRLFDYKHIPEWQERKESLSECEEKHKQAFIAKEKGLLTASEDGEEIVMPEVSYRKSSIILKKTPD